MKEDYDARRARTAEVPEASVNPEQGTLLVLAFDAGPATLAKVGGKGVSLGRMARAVARKVGIPLVDGTAGIVEQ